MSIKSLAALAALSAPVSAFALTNGQTLQPQLACLNSENNVVKAAEGIAFSANSTIESVKILNLATQKVEVKGQGSIGGGGPFTQIFENGKLIYSHYSSIHGDVNNDSFGARNFVATYENGIYSFTANGKTEQSTKPYQIKGYSAPYHSSIETAGIANGKVFVKPNSLSQIDFANDWDYVLDYNHDKDCATDRRITKAFASGIFGGVQPPAIDTIDWNNVELISESEAALLPSERVYDQGLVKIIEPTQVMMIAE